MLVSSYLIGRFYVGMLLSGYLIGLFYVGMLLSGYVIGWFYVGMLLSGYLIGRFKFRARVLAGWNLFVTGAAIVILVSVFQVDLKAEDAIQCERCNFMRRLCNSIRTKELKRSAYKRIKKIFSFIIIVEPDDGKTILIR